ncbi:MAG TPA: tRNA preQ1(34) S-adenosylmethionine ribosyltransferase-isomerase QueA [Candidatus Acidoferrum sp.]|nr:tRNA preQ1(34) S-adenosylmethionine ribosyltransferase-isomerase QueA [Candidatus Acidoferrum sp.]
MTETGRVRTADFHFDLPQDLIAQHPAPRRDESRLLVLHRGGGGLEHRQFRDLPDFLRAGDVLVLNDSRVIPARLRGTNLRTGGLFEMLLLEENGRNDWWAMVRPGKRARPGTHIACRAPDGTVTAIRATVVETNREGHRRLFFSGAADIGNELDRLGEVPLPPYLQRVMPSAEDRERYQTVYAQAAGSVAAPTAGLHFTPGLLAQIQARGVSVCFATLHVGPGTFQPVKTGTLTAHRMHEERFELGAETARIVNEAKNAGRRVWGVGTTAVRVLESVAAQNGGKLAKTSGKTGIFIYPPFSFQIVNALLTNFHLPRSTLLMLVSAFAAPGETSGREMVLAAYAEAIGRRYRFFSYGDAMLIV